LASSLFTFLLLKVDNPDKVSFRKMKAFFEEQAKKKKTNAYAMALSNYWKSRRKPGE
jgi:hypothetical protein